MNDILVVGLAVMGKNLAMNIADRDYQVAVYNRTYQRTLDAVAQDVRLKGYENIQEAVNSLKSPRKILLMVKAGQPVDDFIQLVLPYTNEGDLIIDGGNSNFLETIGRAQEVESTGRYYMGLGVSGGEEGARFGPALMPGGSEQGYELVKDILQDIAAVAYGEPCTSYIGADGSGHYVKMVHNGIEYGDMQLIAEAYHMLKASTKLTNDQIADIFEEWNQGELESYLIEITSEILRVKDGDGYLVDKIMDKAGQKGTGKWTVISSMDLGVDTSLIASSVYARIISSLKTQRVIASKVLTGPQVQKNSDTDFVEKVRQALYASKIMSYAQGFALLQEAAIEHQWQLNYENIAKGWRGGCIIRAQFLNRIAQAYAKDSSLNNLLLDPEFKQTIESYQGSLRQVVSLGIASGIPLPGFSSAIAYYDSYRSDWLPANLIQAQRDFFGAHSFERLDQEGDFHYEWTQL